MRVNTPAADSPAWPAPPAPVAYCGLAGEIVRAIYPDTEADPVAILSQVLTAFGSIIGRGPHYAVEGDQHHGNLFTVLVGDTSKGRKGTAWSRVQQLFEGVDGQWLTDRVMSGLSSGEGLIWQVRDPTKHLGKDGDDPGVEDKRLLVLETEFAKVLRVIARNGNTLSPLIRQAWDRGNLRVMTKNSPAVATGAHISIIGHIVADELSRYLTRTESGNGFANRFLYICVRRSKCLPEGGGELDLAALAQRLREAVQRARTVEPPCITFNSEARALWHRVYPELSEGIPGLVGAVISRAEAQVVRLALLYSLLDGSAEIKLGHLEAALALWAYAEASARYIFGSASGDPVAAEVLRAIRAAPDGMTRTDISNLFGRHKDSADIERALETSKDDGLVVVHKRTNGSGRPTEIWNAV